MAGHNFVETHTPDLLPALWAVRLPYGFPVKQGSEERTREPQR